MAAPTALGRRAEGRARQADRNQPRCSRGRRRPRSSCRPRRIRSTKAWSAPALGADPLGAAGWHLAEVMAYLHYIQPTAREAVTAVRTGAIDAAGEGGAGAGARGELVSRLAGLVAEARCAAADAGAGAKG